MENEENIKIPRKADGFVVGAGILSILMGIGLIIIAAALLTGCSTLGCLGCTETYKGKAVTIEVRERINPAFPRMGQMTWNAPITKLVSVDNPFDKNVKVFIDCGWDSEWDIVIGAHKTQMLLVNSTQRNAYRPSCAVRDDWTFTDAPATY